MTEKPSLTKLIKENAGLSDQGALVYKIILIVGSLTIGEVCEYTGLSYEVASKALDELVDKKLVRKLTQVINRYVAVAPYRAFAELLVELQRAMKELEEDARKSVESALAEISKTNETWKASATKLREEQVGQARQDIRSIREEATNARRNLVDKFRQETEAKRSSLTDMLKRHIGEHTAKISEVETDITLKVDNSVAKFAETALSLKEQVSQTATSYLGKFDEKLELFLGAVNGNLASFESDFSSSVQSFQGQASGFLDDSGAKMLELTEVVRTKTINLIHETDDSFAQLSTQLQASVSRNAESAIGAVSATNRDLELNLTGVTKTYAEKLSEAISSYQARTRETIDGWSSMAKGELESRLNALREYIENHAENLTQKIDSTKNSMSELMKSYSLSVGTSSNDLNSNLVSLNEALKGDLTTKTGSPMEELQESCEATAKECNSLASTLEDLSKKNIPLTSKAIEDFRSDVNSKLSKMTTSLVANAKSFASEVTEKAIQATEALTIAQPRAAPAESGRRGDETQTKGTAMRKDLSKKINEAANSYIVEIKKSTDAIDKYASDRISATLGFEKQLQKKWDAITDTLDKVTELAEEIRSFPQRTGKTVDDLIEQYGKKADGTVASTSRLLNVHSTTLGDTISSTMKKWSATVEKAKKEIVELSEKGVEELSDVFSKHLSATDNIITDRTKTLADLVTQKIDVIKSEALASQANISKHVGSNTESIKGSLKDTEGQMESALLANRAVFKTAMDSKSKEYDEVSAELINRVNGTTSNLKEQLVIVINGGKEQAKKVCEGTSSQLRETISNQSKELYEIVSSATGSFGEITEAASKDYKEEGESVKGAIAAVLSQHLKEYTESVNRAIGEISTTFTEHFEDCNRLTEDFGQKLDELLVTHQDKYERTSIKMTEGLTNCINQDEKAINDTSQKMLKKFTDNTTTTAREAGSVENLMRAAWAEIIDTQQINADKTWHYVTKQAILHHIKDMAKRTKSTVTIVVPNLEEAPLKEVKEISRAIRINIIAGIDEIQHKKLLKELFTQGNVRIWNRTEKDYMSCTRDAEEIIIAPVAGKDMDCVALVSVEEGFIKLIMKIVGPMWLASSKMVSSASL